MNEGTYLGGRLKKIAEDVGVDGEVHGSSEMNLVIYILEKIVSQRTVILSGLNHQERRRIELLSRLAAVERLVEQLTPLANPRFPFVNSAQVVNEVSAAPLVFEKPGFSADVTQQKLLDQLNAVRRQVNTVSDQLNELPHSVERCVVCKARESLTKIRDEINAMTIKISGHLRYTGEPS